MVPPMGTFVSYNDFYLCTMKSLDFVMKNRRFFEVVYEYYVLLRSNQTKVFFGDYFRDSVHVSVCDLLSAYKCLVEFS